MQHTFENVNNSGSFNIIIEYRHHTFCQGSGGNLISRCFVILDQRTFTISESLVCEQIINHHNNNEPALILRDGDIEINCHIQNNKATIIRSGTKIRALPGSSSGAGSNTFFHAFIEPCTKSNSKTLDDSTQDITQSNKLNTLEQTFKTFNTSTSVQQNITYNSNLSIHPNPSPGLFNINIQSKEQLQVNIEVYDMAGRQVYSKHNARLQEEVDLSGAKSGIYFIRIQASDEIFTEKLVVQ